MSGSVPHRFVVPPELDGTRLDRALAALNPGWSRSHAQRMVDGGRVSVDGALIRAASAAVRRGSAIEVLEPPVGPPAAHGPLPEEIALDVIHEDDEVLVVNKPSGLAIHPAAGTPRGTLVNALLHHTDRLSRLGGGERPGIVHRLDKDTTGVMVVARTDRAHQSLALAFRRREVRKTYAAVCFGVPVEHELVVDAPIGRHPRDRQRMAVTAGGRGARTLVEVRERFRGAALVAASPVTGRTHQIRVHLASAGHALVGDPVYAGRQWRNLPQGPARRACRDFPRQALHAWRLTFRHPADGVERTYEAALPDDLRLLLEVLREDAGRPAADEPTG